VHPYLATGRVDEVAGQPKMVGMRMRNDQPTNIRESEPRTSERAIQLVQRVAAGDGRIPCTAVHKAYPVVGSERVRVYSVEAGPRQGKYETEYTGSRLAAAMLDHRFPLTYS
jgi:hypothetical protein